MITLPHHRIAAQNPIWEFELRHDPRLRSPQRLVKFAFVVFPLFAIIPAILFSLWNNEMQRRYGIDFALANGSYALTSQWSGVLTLGVNSLIAVTVTWMLITDIGMIIASGVANHDLDRPDYRELLSLTLITAQQVIAAKQSIIEVRSWRLFTVETGLRISLVSLGLAQFLSVPAAKSITPFQEFVKALGENPLPMLIVCFALALCLYVYILEPYWRMRAMIAIGTRVVVQFKDLATRSFMSLILLVGVRLGQVPSLGVVLGLAVLLFNTMSLKYVSSIRSVNTNDELAREIVLFVGLCVGFVVTFIFYRIIRTEETASAERELFKHN